MEQESHAVTPKERELERLLEVSALLTSTLDLGALLTQILENAEKLMEATASNVMLMDHSTQELYYQVALGQAASQIKDQKRLKLGTGIAGWVAAHEKPLLIEDAYNDPRFFSDFDKKTGFRTKSILCIPLKSKDRLIGIAQIINKKGGLAFTLADQELFSKFGNIAAVAIDNALLHQQILEQDRLRRDMLIAEEIQQAALPSRIPRVPQLRVDYRSIPCRQVGGDVVEVVDIGAGKLGVLVADVSGKGVPAALFGAKFSTEFKYEVKNSPDGGVLFRRLNQVVAERSTRGMFITAIYGEFDSNTGRVKLVNAGHPVPFIVGPNAGQLRMATSAEYPPLGILSDQEYETTELQLSLGEHLVFTTDGVSEAKSPTGARLGEGAASDVLKADPALAMMRLFEELNRFTQGEAPADDVTVVDVRFGPYDEYEIPSDPSRMAEIRQCVEKRASQIGLSEKTQGRISLAVTEALANVIKHTYKMELQGRIKVGIASTSEELQIYIRDWGPKQDAKAFVSRDLADIKPGGLGVYYMRQTMSVVEYDSTHREGNELFMMIKKLEGN